MIFFGLFVTKNYFYEIIFEKKNWFGSDENKEK